MSCLVLQAGGRTAAVQGKPGPLAGRVRERDVLANGGLKMTAEVMQCSRSWGQSDPWIHKDHRLFCLPKPLHPSQYHYSLPFSFSGVETSAKIETTRGAHS